MPPPPQPAAAARRQQRRRRPFPTLLSTAATLAAAATITLLHARPAHGFLLPAAATSGSSYSRIAPPTPTTSTALWARYTSKDTGDRKRKNRQRGFQNAKKRAANRGGKGGDGDEEGGGVVFGDEGSPDGEEEVLELSVDVDELLNFASNLEKALKGVATLASKNKAPKTEEGEGAGAGVNVILNATSLHWLLGQVAYDTGVRQLAIPGLGQMKDAAPLLPDDVEWVLTSGLNEKSVRRIPAIDSLRAVYVSTMEQALLLEQALEREEKRLAERPSYGSVSKSRAKFLEKRAAEKGGKKAAAARAAAAAGPLLKAVVLAPPSGNVGGWDKEAVLSLARGIEEQCPRLVLWGLSLEKCGCPPDGKVDTEAGPVAAVNPLRSMLGRDPVVILPMEGQEPLAQAITKTQSLAWASLATMVTVEAPNIEVGVEGIQPDIGEEDEEGEDGDGGGYDPLAAEGDGLEEGDREAEVGLDYGDEVFTFDFEGEEEEEEEDFDDGDGDEMDGEGEEEAEPVKPAAPERRQGPVSMGGGGKGRGKKPSQKREDEGEEGDGAAGAFGSGLDRKGW